MTYHSSFFLMTLYNSKMRYNAQHTISLGQMIQKYLLSSSMCGTEIEIKRENDLEQESSEFQIATRKKKQVYSQSNSVKRYHKIPLRTQQLLFEQVFNQGRRIKQVAKELKMNYSSAKSLIHYYKTQKRPAPEYIQKLLTSRKQANYSSIQSKQIRNIQFTVILKIKKVEMRSFNYYESLKEGFEYLKQ